jgi:hypothetical protein
MDEVAEKQPWPLRIPILLLLGAGCGAGIEIIGAGREAWRWSDDPLRLGVAAFLAVAGMVFAFTLEWRRWTWSAAFASVAGLLAASVVYRNGGGSWGAGEGWQLFSAILGVGIAIPFFQAARDTDRWRPDYASVHDHIWIDILLWGAAWALVIAVMMLAHLLGELFALIGLDFLKSLLLKAWFRGMVAGSAFGAAVGLLRDRSRLLGLLRKAISAILSVLAPILALGLGGFVLMLPVMGLHTLWDQTRATTPILLTALLGAFSLANVVIGTGNEDEPRPLLVRWSAMLLGLVMLPMGVVAAVSTTKRIAQYGLTPDRLWACVFVAVAISAGIFYLVSIAHRRTRWPEDARQANLALAIAAGLIALFLALPIVSFGAVSARDQIARLQSGEVTPAAFDWSAVRWDFGPSGRDALVQLQRSRAPLIADLAARALSEKDGKGSWMDERIVDAAMSPRTVIVRPSPLPLPPALQQALMEHHGQDDGVCTGRGTCTLYWKPTDTVAVAVADHCASPAPLPALPGETRPWRQSCSIETSVLGLNGGKWERVGTGPRIDQPPADTLSKSEKAQSMATRQAIVGGEFEVREVKRRQLFVGGRPMGEPFE